MSNMTNDQIFEQYAEVAYELRRQMDFFKHMTAQHEDLLSQQFNIGRIHALSRRMHRQLKAIEKGLYK